MSVGAAFDVLAVTRRFSSALLQLRHDPQRSLSHTSRRRLCVRAPRRYALISLRASRWRERGDVGASIVRAMPGPDDGRQAHLPGLGVEISRARLSASSLDHGAKRAARAWPDRPDRRWSRRSVTSRTRPVFKLFPHCLPRVAAPPALSPPRTSRWLQSRRRGAGSAWRPRERTFEPSSRPPSPFERRSRRRP